MWVHGTRKDKGKGVVRDTAFWSSDYPEAAKRGTRTAERWKPPPVGWVKLNTDAGFCSEFGKASVSRRAGSDEQGFTLCMEKFASLSVTQGY
jgi:hypothetical protein